MLKSVFYVIVLTLILGYCASIANAQTPTLGTPAAGSTATIPKELESPRATMFTFLQGIHDQKQNDPRAWTKILACLDLSNLGDESTHELAKQLYEVLNRIGEVKAEELPDIAAIGSLANSRFQYFPRYPDHQEILKELKQPPPGKIVMARQPDGRWLFSAQTLATLPQLYGAMVNLPDRYMSGAGHLLASLGPTFEKTPWFGWMILLGAIFMGLLIGKVAQSTMRAIGGRLHRRQSEYRGTIFDNAASPLSLFFFTLGLQAGMGSLFMSQSLTDLVGRIVSFLYILTVGWFLYNLVDVFDLWLRQLTAKTESKLDDMIVPLIRKALRIFLIIIFTLVVAQNVFGLNITGWLAGLGIAGLAISLAAQDSVKNLFGSITVFFDKPFAVGDFINFEGHDASVEEIGFRSTRLRTLEGHLVTVPNMKFIDNSVRNITARPSIRRILDVTVTYDTTPEKIEEGLSILKEILAQPEISEVFDLEKLPPRVVFNDFNAASLNLRVIYWYILNPDRNFFMYLQHAEKFNLQLLRRFNAAGIDFAFPTQTLYLAGDAKRPLVTKS